MKSLFESFILSIRQEFDLEQRFIKSAEYKIFASYRELVEQHYMEHLKLDDYAHMMGVTKKTINLATRATVDLSAKDYLNQRLLLEIKRYLIQGDLLIYEILDLLGFDEPANMTKFFRRYEGIPPKKFNSLL